MEVGVAFDRFGPSSAYLNPEEFVIWIPPKDIPNGTKGVWRGPCVDAAEIVPIVAKLWPEEHWPNAAAIPFAEVGLSTPVGVLRKRQMMVWTGSIGDLTITSPKFGPSYGAWQVRHVLSETQPPLDLAGNAVAAYRRWLVQGFGAWSTFKKGDHRPHLPMVHRAIADFLERS